MTERVKMQRGLQSWLPWALAALSGIMLGGCFPPCDRPWLSWLPWMALSPLCWSLWMLPAPVSIRRRARKAFLLGWLTGSISFLISLFWITTVTWVGWVALCLVVGLYPSLWAIFAALVLRPLGKGNSVISDSVGSPNAWLGSFRNLLVALLAASSWTSLEWVRGWLFSGFGWNSLGIALRENIPLIQIAGITGTAGLTFLCVLGSATVAITLERLRREILSGRPRPHVDFFAAVMLVMLVFSYGAKRLSSPPVATLMLRAAGVQGNIPVYDYWETKSEPRIMGEYLRQSRLALSMDPDLLVWPEAATPEPVLLDEIIYNQVKDLLSAARADILIGSVHYEKEPRGDYNSAILLTNHAGNAQIYNKVHLVPFGEYVPFRHSFPVLGWIEGKRVPYDFDSGKGPVLLELSVKPVKLGPLICFEDTLGDLTRRSALLGAQLLMTITNDGWFERSIATRQHLANARLRTVETDLPMMRVADTGVTCVIDRFGRTQEILEGPGGDTFIEGTLHSSIAVPMHPVPTFYTLHGDLFAKICFVTMIAAIVVTIPSWRRRETA